jgi:hypothetical protein
VLRALDDNRARELIRVRQQGYGRPIISVQADGYRTVAVGSRVMWSQRWLYFTDFLLDYLKDRLGRDWGAAQVKADSTHPVFRWLARLGQDQKALGASGGTYQRDEVGYITALFGLGYALYLIEHHDQLVPGLLARLREETGFRATVAETLAAAAFARAGFAIRWAELRATGRPTPEFEATSAGGVTFAVEVKCKDVWRAVLDPSDEAFAQELRQWVRDQLYKGSKKKLTKPIYWLELSLPARFSEAQWRKVHAIVVRTIAEADTITIAGAPATPAYVFITNNAQLVDDDVEGSPLVAMLEGFRIPEMKGGQSLPMEVAMAVRDRHREVTFVLECLRDVHRIPMTFDGHPVELLDGAGAQRESLRIGQRLQVDFPDGTLVQGVVEDVCSIDDTAHVCLNDAGVRKLITMPLTLAEAAAAKIYGDAIFGRPVGPHRNLEGDPLALYDWFLETYQSYPREALLKQMSMAAPQEPVAHLSNQELATRLARGYALSAHLRAARAPGQV